jgi:hypothetical protein
MSDRLIIKTTDYLLYRRAVEDSIVLAFGECWAVVKIDTYNKGGGGTLDQFKATIELARLQPIKFPT